MPVFGGYETVGQLSPTPFGSVYKARAAGSDDGAIFIVKTFIPLGADETDLKRHPEVRRFLGGAELQKLVAATSKHWAPVHGAGISREGAFYVSTFYPTSASRLIKGKTKLGADDLHALTEAVLAGLVELRQCCRRSHGNLSKSTILLPRMDASGYGQAMLAEPLAADSTQAASEQGDLAALGRVIYELVMHKPYNVAGAWPIPDSPEWARMGKRGAGWREFTNKLLSSDPADALTLEQAQAMLERLRPKKALVPMWAVAATILVLLIGGGLFAYFNFRPDPNFGKEWVVLVDSYRGWFRLFADKDLSVQLPAEYDPIKELVEKAQNQKHMVLDPREISGQRDWEENKKSPPSTRDGQAKAKDAIELAKLVQRQLMERLDAKAPAELDAQELPKALAARVKKIGEKYTDRKWPGPAQYVASLTENPPQEGSGAYFNWLVNLLRELPAMENIERDWAVVEERMRQVKDTDDPILKQFPDLVHRRIYGDGGGNVTLAETARKVEGLRGDFEKDDFWGKLAQFVSKEWKEVEREKFLATSIYEPYLRQPPRQLDKRDLQTWWEDAQNYLKLTEENPARKKQFADLLPHARTRFDLVLQHYAAKNETPAEVETIKAELARVDLDVAELQKMDWRSGTRKKVQTGVDEIASRVQKLNERIEQAINRTKYIPAGDIVALLAQLRRQEFSPVIKPRWEAIKKKWGLDDPEKLKEGLKNPDKFASFRELTIKATQSLQSLELALADPVKLSDVSRDSAWNANLSKAIVWLEEAERRRLLDNALNTYLDVIAREGSIPQRELDRWKAGFASWRNQANAFIAEANLLEDHLDAGFGIQVEASPTSEFHQKLTKGKFYQDTEVQKALAPLTDRYAALVSLQQESRPATLAEIAQNNTDPARALDAWQRLHSAGINWPTTVDELELERQLREAIVNVPGRRTQVERAKVLAKQRQEALKEELADQGPVIWRRFVVSTRGSDQVAGALARAMEKGVRDDFRVGDPLKLQPPLPLAVQFNIFLLEGRRYVKGLEVKLEDKKAQDEVQKLLDSLPQGNDPAISKFRETLQGYLGDAGGGAAAAVDAGPMAKHALQIWQHAGNDDELTFTWNGKGHQLRFVRVDNKKQEPFFLCTTEVTLGLFAEVMSLNPPAAMRLPQEKNMRGPMVWEWDGKRIKEARQWLPTNTQLREKQISSYAPGLGHPQDLNRLSNPAANPSLDTPMAQVPPDTAMYFASLLGCRLPTSTEWQAAAAQVPGDANAQPNLRDATWAAQRDYVKVLRGKELIQAKYPDTGMVKCLVTPKENEEEKALEWSAKALADKGFAVSGKYDDGYLFLRPVGDGQKFSDLVGNVAEMVWDDPPAMEAVKDKSPAGMMELLKNSPSNLFVVGGSAISAPEFGIEKHQLKIDQPYADLGFRLAFVAAKRSIVERLKETVDKQPFLAVAAN